MAANVKIDINGWIKYSFFVYYFFLVYPLKSVKMFFAFYRSTRFSYFILKENIFHFYKDSFNHIYMKNFTLFFIPRAFLL